MKKIILSVLLIAGITGMATAQNVRLNAYAGYVFGDQINPYTNSATNYYTATVNGGFQWGAGIEYMAQPTVGVEIKYLRQDTKAPVTYYNNGPKATTLDLGINWILLDGNYYFNTGNTNIEPYLGGGIGVAIINATNPLSNTSASRTAFAWDIKGGVNFWFNKKVGIKLQASLLDASKATGGYYYYGVNTYSYTNLLQFGLGGGLTFRFGK